MRAVALLAVAVALSALLAYRAVAGGPIARPPGVLAPAEPAQGPVAGNAPWLARDGFVAAPLATFALEARVILKRDYADPGARVAPVDLALGWGPMSDTRVLERLRFSQAGRFYSFWAPGGAWPIPLENAG